MRGPPRASGASSRRRHYYKKCEGQPGRGRLSLFWVANPARIYETDYRTSSIQHPVSSFTLNLSQLFYIFCRLDKQLLIEQL